jgi:hypothetical protein
MPGPRRSKTYESRFAAAAAAAPVATRGSVVEGSESDGDSAPYPVPLTPTKPPVSLPHSDFGAMRACSSASQDHPLPRVYSRPHAA